jgi:SAM-dependent methyltransferase
MTGTLDLGRRATHGTILPDEPASGLVDYACLQRGSEFDTQGVQAAHLLYEKLIGLWAPTLIEAAHELGVFTELANGPAAASGLAAALGTDDRATRVLLDALYAYGLLTRGGSARQGHLYALSPSYRECLLPGGQLSLTGKFIHDQRIALPAWRRLPDAVRSGTHSQSGAEQVNQIDEDDYRSLAGGISFWAPPVVDLLSDELFAAGWDPDSPKAILDVGCGTGLYSHLLLRRFRSARALGLDAPQIAQLAAAAAGELGVDDRFSAQGGDFWKDPWRANQDLILFVNIFHLQTPSSAQQLLRSAAEALATGGIVCITDQIRVGDDEDDSPQNRFAVLFAASMLATGGGDTYRLETYDRWLRLAGLRRIQLLDAPMHRILLATAADFTCARGAGQ